VAKLIVVVDDDESNRSVAQEVLADAGYRVLAFKDAADLRQLSPHERPALVILDGSLVTAARNTAQLRDVPVIIVSAAFGPAIQRDATAIGARGWLQKPFEIDDLVALVQAHADTSESP
jgi:CheY-like chemotaxis protein